MRKFNKVLALLISLSIFISLVPSFSSQAGSIKLNRTKVTLEVGSTLQLAIVGKPNKTVKWSSSNKSVASVSKGLIKAKNEGKTTITAKIGNKKLTCKVTVKAKKTDNSIPDDSKGFNIRVKEGINVYVLRADNITDRALDIKVIFTSYNEDGTVFQSQTVYAFGVTKGDYAVFSFDKPNSISGMSYSGKYDIQYVTREVNYTTYSNDSFKVKLVVEDGIAFFLVTNNTGETINGVNIAYTFYDEQDRLLYGDTITSEQTAKNGEELICYYNLWYITEKDSYGNLISYVPDNIDSFACCVFGF